MNLSPARLGIGLGLGLGTILTLANLCLLPFIKKEIDRRLQTWIGHMSVALHYENLRLSWLGVRIEGIRLSAHDLQAEGEAEIKLSLRPDRSFLRPNHIVLDDWNVLWQRSQAPRASGARNPSAKPPARLPLESLSRVEKTLDLLFQRDITLELRNSRLKMLDAHRQELLTLPAFDLTFAAQDQSMHIKAKKLLYRKRQVLGEIEGQLLLQREKARYPFLMTARDTGDVPWQLQGSMSRDFDSLEMRHKRQGIPDPWQRPLRWIGPHDKLQLLFKLSLQGLRRQDTINFDVHLVSNNLELKHNLLGNIPWGPFPFSLRAKGDFSLETGSFKFGSGLAHLIAHKDRSPIRVFFQGEKKDLLAPLAEEPLQLSVKLPETPCQIFLEALPEHAFPLINGFALQGTVASTASVQLMRTDEQLIKLGEHSFTCQLQSIPERFSKKWLLDQRGSLSASAENPDLPGLAALSDPDYVPLKQISEAFLQGIISAEDGGFWKHDGFRWGSLQAALQANLKAGRVIYGGSTLTMQLVKNLYLSRERVLSRKIQELYLAWTLEQVLSKEDILELYANIVEFGPGMRGIAKASRAYFGKSPRDLSVAEAIYLASILPNPHKAFATHYCSGQLDEGIVKRMQKTAEGVSSLIGQAQWQREFQYSLGQFRFQSGSSQRNCDGSFNIGLKSKPGTQAF